LRGSLVEFHTLNEAVMLKQVVFLGLVGLVSAAVLPGNLLGAFNHDDYGGGRDGLQELFESLGAETNSGNSGGASGSAALAGNLELPPSLADLFGPATGPPVNSANALDELLNNLNNPTIPNIPITKSKFKLTFYRLVTKVNFFRENARVAEINKVLHNVSSDFTNFFRYPRVLLGKLFIIRII
jgi:hypothetical protein